MESGTDKENSLSDEVGDLDGNLEQVEDPGIGALRSILRWPLVVMMFLWALILLGIGILLSVGSYGGQGPLFFLLALAQGIAAIPFLVPTSPASVIIARVVTSLEGCLIGAVGIGIGSMADSLVSMGNSHNSDISTSGILGLLIGGVVAFLAWFAKTPQGTIEGESTSSVS